MIPESTVPQPGPARLPPNAGPDEWLEQAKQCKYLPEDDMKRLCELVKERLMEESNIQPVRTPVTICGDIHGQFYDLLELFNVAGGMPSDDEPLPSAPSPPSSLPSSLNQGAISAAALEPPSQISDPKVRRKMKRRFQQDSAYTSAASNASNPSDDNEDEIMFDNSVESRGRMRRRSAGETDANPSSIRTSSTGEDDDMDLDEDDGNDSGIYADQQGPQTFRKGQLSPSKAQPGSSSLTNNGKQNFVFLGDFVDRGYFSLETFTLLMCLKVKFPDRVTLVRGNHESRQITQVYGFYEECQTKYGNASVWKSCCQVFDFLALAAIVDGKVLCVHGGLSPEIRTLDQIRVVARAQEIPHEGAFCDLVWSDPEDVETWAVSPRGAGWLFGDKIATEFNHVNGLQLIARAHQLVNEGFKYHFANQDVVTVWSAPNYCYRCGNVASIMSMTDDLEPEFTIFNAVPDHKRAVPGGRGRTGDYFL